MSQYVFRNNTVEPLFPGSEYLFSGYDDVSAMPTDADGYVWFYQVPLKYDAAVVSAEIDGYAQELQWVVDHLPADRPFIAITLEDLYGIRYCEADHRVTEATNRFNRLLLDIASEHDTVKVLDFADFLNDYKRSEVLDWKYYFISQLIISPKIIPAFRAWYAKKMEEIALKRKKCIVLDLDNTLWGGVLGEEGIDGIAIGGDYPGKAFLYFQKALLTLSANGVILAVCSKNNEADVLEAWEKNPFMVIRKEQISAYRINWQDKAANLKALSEELNIGLDSFVFVDDNPAERELIRQMLPMVAVPDFPPHPYGLPLFVKEMIDRYFKVYAVTDEDRRKTEQYRANANRTKEMSRFTNFSDYLRSLGIKMVIEKADTFNIPRIAQMTQKTNQFNLTTQRYTDTDIRRFVAEDWQIYCIAVSDRFGDNGITGCLMVDGDRIDSLLLSCRILGKGIEIAFVKSVMQQLARQGMHRIRASYLPTKKNGQTSDFYERCGFAMVRQTADGEKDYELNLDNADFRIEDYYDITYK